MYVSVSTASASKWRKQGHQLGDEVAFAIAAELQGKPTGVAVIPCVIYLLPCKLG